MPTTLLQELQAQVNAQGDVVKKLKRDKAEKKTIKAEVNTLKNLKKQLEDAIAEHKAANEVHLRYRANVESLLTRRFFYQQAFEIYGGIAGLYDYGPPGCALLQNIIDQWRRHFVFPESMLEVNCTCVTPEIVLKTSGHVDKFTDFMVTDTLTGECYRADKLLEDFIDRLISDPLNPVTDERKDELLAISSAADDYSQEQLGKILKDLDVKPEDVTECKLTDPYPFNLMFATSIGPSGRQQGYLRPETAQGIFVNFGRLLGYNNGQMPFAAAQIGLAFRNEIAPRAGLLRVREFQMMEIEHFCNPNDKKHTKFDSVAGLTMSLLDQSRQDGKGNCLEITIGEAVEQV
jgi:glycyl-tRNA synthetase